MGNTWEAVVWKNGDYHEIYRGESLLKAAIAMWRAARAGGRCMKLVWRPT
jgi:hypothetical protein